MYNNNKGLTNMPKQVQLCEDDVIGRFYQALFSDNNKALKEIHIPRSDVFYVERLYIKLQALSTR